jgi:photosystem II stability/assembly factor-like uncharacterized protein
MNATRIPLVVLAFALGICVTVSTKHPLRENHLPVSSEEAGRGTSGAMEALAFWNDARAYPSRGIPPSQFYRAYTSARSLKKSGQALASAWEPMGPINFVGRMISVAVNPLNSSTVYVGSASAGLWRSPSGGTNGDWERITTGYPVLGVAAIAIDTRDTNTIYIGTGEVYRYQGTEGGVAVRTTRGSYGLGILKTTNSGRSWQKSLDWSANEERGVQAIRINPLNSATVFAATTEGIYRSSDGGASWSNVLGVVMAEDIIIKPSDTTLMIASCGNFSSPGAGIYLSIDGGLGWSQTENGLPAFSGKTLLEMYAANPTIVYASIADSTTGTGGLYRTTDFGLSWQLLNSYSVFSVQGWYSHFVAVNPADNSKMIHAGVPIMKSTDGGTSFFSLGTTYADEHSYAHDPANPDVLYVVDDGGVWRTSDFGDGYEFVGYGLSTAQLYNGFSTSTTDSLLAMGQVQDHIPGVRYLGATSWVDGGVDEAGWTAIDPTDDRNTYAVNREGGGVYKFTNRGGTLVAYSPLDGQGAWNTPLLVSPSNPSILYCGKSLIHQSTDGGYSWTAVNFGAPLDGNPALSMAMSFTNPDTVYVGTAPLVARAHVYRTADGGSHWQDISGSALPDRYPMDLAVDPKDSRTVYAAFGGYGTGHFFKSTDAGAHWTDITGNLPDVHATAVAVDPLVTNHVYVGNDLGVFVSTSGGSDWISFNEGFPEAVLVSDLVISPSNRSLRAATHGNGAYQRKLLPPVTGVEEQGEVPLDFSLGQNYPNPFNPSTTISYTLRQSASVSLNVYDLLGREVATIASGRLGPGTYRALFTPRNLPGGLYLYRLRAGPLTISKKMLFIP